MSNKYKEQAQNTLITVGGAESIVDATYDTKCTVIHIQHTIPSTADEVKQIVDVTSVVGNDMQLVIKSNGDVDEVHQQLQRLIKNANVEESKNTDNINSQDTSYAPQVKITTPILVKVPTAGRRILPKEVRDPIFRGKMISEGLAIKAHEESKVIASFNGLISMTVPTKHAVGIQSEDGVDIVIHISLNTVDLEGKGFKCFVEQNDHVGTGQTLLQSDQQYIQQQGYNADVTVVISDSTDLGKVELTMNEIVTTEDVIFKIFKN